AGCMANDMMCIQKCAMDQQGAMDHDALVMCLQTSCMMECSMGKICDSGLGTPKKPACGDCLGMNCCAEFDACTADATCKTCLLMPMTAGCNMNALAKTANDCAAMKCAMPCTQ